jgi:hypothetical protein
MSLDIKLLIGAAFCLGAFAGIVLLLFACVMAAWLKEAARRYDDV